MTAPGSSKISERDVVAAVGKLQEKIIYWFIETCFRCEFRYATVVTWEHPILSKQAAYCTVHTRGTFYTMDDFHVIIFVRKCMRNKEKDVKQGGREEKGGYQFDIIMAWFCVHSVSDSQFRLFEKISSTRRANGVLSYNYNLFWASNCTAHTQNTYYTALCICEEKKSKAWMAIPWRQALSRW